MKKHLALICTVLLTSFLFGQSMWYEIPTGTDKKLVSIDFPSNNVGYIVGQDSTILKTIDGGQTWMSLGLNGISISAGDDYFTDVDFIDETTGFLVSGYSGVWRTTDGAQTWTFIGSSMCFPYAVYPFSEVDYLIGGGSCFEGAKIDKVVNNVSTAGAIDTTFWDDQQKVLHMSFASSTRGLAAVRNEYILRTIDGGSTWDTIPTGISGTLTSVLMIDDNLCYAGYDVGGSSFGILKSIDGGMTWDFDPNLGTSALFINPNYLSVCKAQNGDIYSGANTINSSEGVIFETPDGISWSNTYVDQPINDMTSYGSDITFGVGDSGYLVVNTPIAELGIREVENLHFTVYPNPVQNELMIHNPRQETMEVQILDATGRIIKVENANSGLGTIDTSSLKKGIYFVQVKIGSEFGLQRFVKQ